MTNKKTKNILITWHFLHHGIAFLKHILGVFHKEYKKNDVLTDCKDVSQYEMEDYLNNLSEDEKERGFRFDKIFLFSVEEAVYNKLSTRRSEQYFDILDNGRLDEWPDLKEIFQQFKDNNIRKMDDQLAFISQNKESLELYKKEMWRNIHHLEADEQLKWLWEMSNFTKLYKAEQLEPCKLDEIKNLKFEIKKKALALKKWMDNHQKELENANIYIVTTLSTTEITIAWHILAEADCLPKNCRFINVFDDKSDESHKYLKNFSIEVTTAKVFSEAKLELVPFQNSKTPARELANKLFKRYYDSGFAILIMGERGIGKSHMIKEMKKNNDTLAGKFVECNCASFADDTMFESEVFGHTKGAFTGAHDNKDGLLKEADKGGILFMDEIHHISKRAQAKLLTAFSTSENNEMEFRKLGANKNTKVKNVHLIFASNKKIGELREYLLPDFYDRVVQQVIELPPLRNTRKDIKSDFESIWKQMQFEEQNLPQDEDIYNWMKSIPLYGNFRDLQKIAIYYNNFIKFDDETKKFLEEKTPLEYAQKQFNEYCMTDAVRNITIRTSGTADDMEREFHKKLVDWAEEEYGSQAEAAKKLEISVRTLGNWKIGK